MKRTNFLKGLAAKLALAVVAFGAMLTSCTKEEFNVEYRPNNAQIYFNVTVIDALSATIVNGATITGAEVITGNPDIAAGTATITATYNGVSGQAIVPYGAVPAGSVVTYSPIIVLGAEYELVKVDSKDGDIEHIIGKGSEGHAHDGSVWNLNSSDYFQKFNVSWDFTRKNEILSIETLFNNPALQNFINAYAGSVNVKGEKEFTVSAWAMYRADLYIKAKEVTYNVVAKTTGDVYATIVVKEAVAEAECKLIEKAIPGHEGHYHHGHGHGDSSNAGGGISWAE